MVADVWRKFFLLRHQAVELWRTSLQVRVIGSILAATVLVVAVLGLFMVNVVAQRLVDAKLEIASSEIDRARIAVEQQIAATDSSNSLQTRVNSARAALANRNGAAADPSRCNGSEAAARWYAL